MDHILIALCLILSLVSPTEGLLNVASLTKAGVSHAGNSLQRKNIVLNMNQETDVVERRKRRRGKVPFESITAKQPEKASNQQLQSGAGSKLEEGLDSFAERLIGLKEDQLRDLMELELPVPQEDKSTGKVVEAEEAGNKVFQLPELTQFLQDTKSKDLTRTKQADDLIVPENTPKINRRNVNEYQDFLQKNPYADSDERYFTKEFDIIPSIFGSGKLLGIGISYLQAGHLMFLFAALVSAFLYSPGNPLTDLPQEIRTFLKQGLVIVYGINAVLAGQAYFIAKGKNLPATFWLIKTLLFGGLSFYEVKQTEDPTLYSNSRPNNKSSKRAIKDKN